MGANIVLALIAACSLHSGTANIDKGSTSINPLSRWRRWAHGADSLRETFTDEALSLLAARRAALARLSTREDWAARQTHVASVVLVRTLVPKRLERGATIGS